MRSFCLFVQGTCFTVPILASWLTDARCQKFWAVFFNAAVYLFGAALLAIASLSKNDSTNYFNSVVIPDLLLKPVFKKTTCISGLLLVALGTAGFKANLSSFGAWQVSKHGPNAVPEFFTYFYWVINLGSLLAYTIVAYVQQDISFFLGFLIPVACIIIALITFVIGSGEYKFQLCSDSGLSMIMKIVKEAISNYRPRTLSGRYVQHWLDRAKVNFGGCYSYWEVEDVKRICQLLPILGTFVLYWTVFSQVS